MRAIDVTPRIRPLDMYPYDDYIVEMKPLAHMHYSYRIDRRRIEIVLSDYLLDAPDKVLNDTCKAIVNWSQGRKFVQPASLGEYVRSEAFIVSSRPKYLSRSRSFLMTQQGGSKNLMDSVERLLDSELINDDDIRNSYITWTDHMAKHKFGQCNQMFRVISVNPILDDERVPDVVVDFVIYHEILHLRQDTSKIRRPHNAQFRSWEHMFPNYLEAEEYLRNIYSTLKIRK